MAKEKQTKMDQDVVRLKKEEAARKNRRRYRQWIGLALTILIVVGAVSIISGTAKVFKSILDNTSEYDEYTQRVTALVWFDVLPFESLDKADKDALLQVSIWGVLNQMGSELNRNEFGEPLVPAIEVDRYAAALFGPDLHFDHRSFEDPVENLQYKFDPETQIYSAPATGLTPPYIPTVVDIKREGNGVKRVTVGYVNTRGSNNEIVATPDLEHPAKFMDFLFQRSGNQYFLFALEKNTTHEVTAPSAPSSQDLNITQLPSSSDIIFEVTSNSAAGSGSAPSAEGESQTEEASSASASTGEDSPG